MKRQSLCIISCVFLISHLAPANTEVSAAVREGCENLTVAKVFCAKGKSGILDVRSANCLGQSDQIRVRYLNGLPVEVAISSAEKDAPLEEWARLTRTTAVLGGTSRDADADTNELMDAAIARAEGDAREFGCDEPQR